MNVDFDSMGTLFELTPVRERLGDAATDTWFERILHSAATLTMFGEFVPFADLARTTLGTTVAKLALDVDEDDVLAQLQQLPPAPEAGEHARAGRPGWLRRAGVRRRRGEGLQARRARVSSRAGRARRGDAVAAHAWDAVGAARAGMRAVWVDREERVWPFPEEVAPHATVPDLLHALG